MPSELLGWLKSQRVEDPKRLIEFQSRLNWLKWDEANLLESLSKVFEAVDTLAMAEVRYYYRRRTSRAYLSGIFRTAAWITGSAGIVLPLLAAADEKLKAYGTYGYALLALAAALLSANALFGGTSGHVRFVTVQLEIEGLMTTARVGWKKFLAGGQTGSTKPVDLQSQGFTLIESYVQALYKLTISETGVWARTIVEELANFSRGVDKAKLPASGEPSPKGGASGQAQRMKVTRNSRTQGR